jgi:hypothetical protein
VGIYLATGGEFLLAAVNLRLATVMIVATIVGTGILI